MKYGSDTKRNTYNCSKTPAQKYQRCRKGYASHQNLLHHYQHSKINLIYLFNLEIQQILETHDLNRHTHFWPYPPKSYWIDFYQHAKNQAIPSFFLELQGIIGLKRACLHFLWSYILISEENMYSNNRNWNSNEEYWDQQNFSS